jgi:uncharacterized protein YceH (UPF0502 family)
MFFPSWALGVAIILIAIQVGRAISGKASRRDLPSDAELNDLRQNLEAMQNRVAELEERVDFAERLLAKPRDQRS